MTPLLQGSAISPTAISTSPQTSQPWRPPKPNGIPERQPTFERISAIFQRVQANVQARTVRPELPYGIPPLDDLTAGLRRGKVAICAARSSQGKTAMASQVAWQLADAGKTVAFITLEDDREEIVERLYCHVTRTDNQLLRRGQPPVLTTAMAVLFDSIRLLVLDNYGYTMPEIAQVVHTLKPTPDVLIVDYAQMIDDEGYESEYRALSVFVRQLKLFAEHTRIATLLCSQVNRQGAQESRPSLHHLARCGRLEEVANAVLMLYCPARTGEASFDYQKDGGGFAEGACPLDYFELSVEKNKTGPRGVVPLRFVGPHYRFEPWVAEARPDPFDPVARAAGDDPVEL